MADPGRSINERVAVVETSLRDHIRSCEKKGERNFRTQLIILGAILSILAKQFGLI